MSESVSSKSATHGEPSLLAEQRRLRRESAVFVASSAHSSLGHTLAFSPGSELRSSLLLATYHSTLTTHYSGGSRHPDSQRHHAAAIGGHDGDPARPDRAIAPLSVPPPSTPLRCRERTVGRVSLFSSLVAKIVAIMLDVDFRNTPSLFFPAAITVQKQGLQPSSVTRLNRHRAPAAVE